MVYVDPVKLEAQPAEHQWTWYKAVNESNLILPAGDVRIGPKDYNIYANSQVPKPSDVNAMPLKTGGTIPPCWWAMWATRKMPANCRYNIVRVDGQHSVYIPIFKQGGGSNTITIVNGVRQRVKHLLDIPPQLKTAVVFDQSVFVKMAVKNVISEGGIGLAADALMILLFLGNMRATVAVLLSIPLSRWPGFCC